MLLRTLAVSTLLLAYPRLAGACSCAGSDSPSEAFDGAHSVFVGTVTSIHGSRSGSGLADRVRDQLGLEEPYGREVRFTVTDSWKGVQSATTGVWTGFGGGDCGIGFNVGSSYLVYAFESEGASYTGICTRTMDVSSASADLAYLQSQPHLTLSAQTRFLPRQIAVSASALAVLVSALWMWRRKREGLPKEPGTGLGDHRGTP